MRSSVTLKKAFAGFLAASMIASGGSVFASAESSDEGKGHIYEEITEDVMDISSYELPESSLYHKNDVMPDTWVFTDGLGRVSLTNADVGDPKEDKTLAMFFWSWHSTMAKRGIVPFNIQAFLDAQDAAGIKYEEYVNNFEYEGWGNYGYGYFWNEPIYGFYRTEDHWVLRRQSELLANAGVDVIFTDTTNGTNTWPDGYNNVFSAWEKAQRDGVDSPKVSMMLPFAAGENTAVQVREYYNEIFRDGKYRSLWFYWENKPMLMAHVSSFGDSDVDKEIKEFFTFRGPQPDYFIKRTESANWGWLAAYPQAKYYATYADSRRGTAEQVTVGICQNANYEDMQLSAMNAGPVMGRSYTSTYKDRFNKEGAEASKWGYNFAEQWNYALEVDPKVVFVTGWNEWNGGRIKLWPENSSAVTNAFHDQFSDEYSRDIEPSKGALKDHYYYQLVNFVRQFKGVRAMPTATEQKTVDLAAGQGQWADVGPYFASYIGNTGDRDCDGYNTCHYTEFSGRNDIIGAQVARDNDYLFFNVECAKDITPYTDNLWMNLYIDVNAENAGWESFDFVVNKTKPTADAAVLERFTGEGYASEKVADVEYRLDGRYLTVKIAKSALGIEGDDYTVNFLWTDNVHDEADTGVETDGGVVYSTFTGDILDFYTSGDVAPGARFKYSYITKSPVVEEPETSADTTAEETPETTVEETAAEEESVAETTAEESASAEDTTAEEVADETAGCKAAGGASSAIASAVILASAVALGKKKKEDA